MNEGNMVAKVQGDTYTQLDFLMNEIERTNSLVRELEKVLSPITMPVPVCDNAPYDLEAGTEIGRRIEDARKRLLLINDSAMYMLGAVSI